MRIGHNERKILFLLFLHPEGIGRRRLSQILAQDSDIRVWDRVQQAKKIEEEHPPEIAKHFLKLLQNTPRRAYYLTCSHKATISRSLRTLQQKGLIELEKVGELARTHKYLKDRLDEPYHEKYPEHVLITQKGKDWVKKLQKAYT